MDENGYRDEEYLDISGWRGVATVLAVLGVLVGGWLLAVLVMA